MNSYLKTIVLCGLIIHSYNTQTFSKKWLFAGAGITALAGACYYAYNKKPMIIQNIYGYIKPWMPTSWQRQENKKETLLKKLERYDSDEDASSDEDGVLDLDSGPVQINFIQPIDGSGQGIPATPISVKDKCGSLRIKRINSNISKIIHLSLTPRQRLLYTKILNESKKHLPIKGNPNTMTGDLMQVLLASIWKEKKYFCNDEIEQFLQSHSALKCNPIYPKIKEFIQNNNSVLNRIMAAMDKNDLKKKKMKQDMILNSSRLRRLKPSKKTEPNRYALWKRIKNEYAQKIEPINKQCQTELDQEVATIEEDVIQKQGILLTQITQNKEFKKLAYTKSDSHTKSAYPSTQNNNQGKL